MATLQQAVRARGDGSSAGTIARPSRLPIVAVVLLLLGGLGVLQVMQTSHVATTGYALSELESLRAGLEAEIRLLEADAAALTREERVRSAAIELGMVEPERVLDVSVDTPAPTVVHLPRRYVPGDGSPEALPGSQRAHWEYIVELLPGLE